MLGYIVFTILGGCVGFILSRSLLKGNNKRGFVVWFTLSFSVVGFNMASLIDEHYTYENSKTFNLLEMNYESRITDNENFVVIDGEQYRIVTVQYNESASVTLQVDFYKSYLSKTEKTEATLIIGSKTDSNKLNMLSVFGYKLME